MPDAATRPTPPVRDASAGPMVQRVYLGNLDPRISKEEITDEVSRFGKLTDVWVARNPPGFAFVTFEDERDARDMMDGLMGGEGPLGRVKIEMAKNQGGRQAGPQGIGRSDRGGYGGPPPRRDQYDDRGRDDRDRRRGYSRSRSRDRDRRRRSRSRSPSDDRRRSKKSAKKYSDESDDDRRKKDRKRGDSDDDYDRKKDKKKSDRAEKRGKKYSDEEA